ncbi:lipopolysaccharide biosynthesis protein [Neobacillus niacini]|uniref:lipopolysaccharide biosynthesis protein n=1 Tax=Neobacillus niacini TaxID=86668 RepID=UPI0021CB8ADA|nr:lipopolysaccharide biosynthesis protein [Neobacillus niacini]MCM3765950.1 lipopolysaccharide biosynthesis protein [Neobacillus niacini]
MPKEGLLKQKAIKSVFWSIGDQFANQGIQFILQIILARILLPEHFGIIGMILVFVLISNIIIESGFSQALIREQDATQTDYSTIFYFNLLLSLLLYGVLYGLAPMVSAFFNEPQIILILRVLSLSLIMNALSIIQRTLLAKKIDFKSQTIINIISGVLSGVIAIGFALWGLGVWSLVIKTLSLQLFQLIFLWIFNKWRPSLIFEFNSLKRFFGFSSNLMLSGLLSVIYSNIYFIVIGKIYSVTQLGYYTNSVKITEAASLSITSALQRVTYPILSTIQNEDERLKYSFKKIIRVSAFINFPLMVGLAAIGDSLVYVLFGEKWMPMVIYFQLLCIAGMLYPLHAIDLNILQVKGKSNLYLQLNITRKVTLTLLIIGAVFLKIGVIGLIGVIILQTYIDFMLNSHFGGREIAYSTIEHIKDITHIYIITFTMGVVVYLSGVFLPVNHYLKLIIQLMLGPAYYIGICKLTRVEELKVVMDIISPLFKRFLTRKNERVINHNM